MALLWLYAVGTERKGLLYLYSLTAAYINSLRLLLLQHPGYSEELLGGYTHDPRLGIIQDKTRQDFKIVDLVSIRKVLTVSLGWR